MGEYKRKNVSVSMHVEERDLAVWLFEMDGFLVSSAAATAAASRGTGVDYFFGSFILFS
jgi:hypothetical protein